MSLSRSVKALDRWSAGASDSSEVPTHEVKPGPPGKVAGYFVALIRVFGQGLEYDVGSDGGYHPNYEIGGRKNVAESPEEAFYDRRRSARIRPSQEIGVKQEKDKSDFNGQSPNNSP